MPGKVVQYKSIGKVTFLKKKQSKNIKISVKPDMSVLVSYPFYCNSNEVNEFVLKNEGWIREQQKKMKDKRSVINEDSQIKTKLHVVTFVLNDKFDIKTQKNKVQIFVKDFSSTRSVDFIEDILTQIYRFEAKTILPKRLAKLAEIYNFKYERVSIRNNRRNWGSCSSGNNISLNLQMMKLPDPLIDYILLHELVHTRIKNHGPAFWETLNRITNNTAREKARQVKEYSTYTL